MATLAQFRAKFTEFADTAVFPDGAVTAALAEALTQMNVAVWGPKADMGQLLLAAHTLAVDGTAFGGVSGAPLGTITSETVGDVSRSFASPHTQHTMADQDLLWTKYGIRYSRLKGTILSTPVVL